MYIPLYVVRHTMANLAHNLNDKNSFPYLRGMPTTGPYAV